MKNKFLFVIYILKFQTRQACDPQIYKCIFPHVFHLFITIISSVIHHFVICQLLHFFPFI